MADLLLEKIGKRLASVGRSSRRGLALNYRSWRKQIACVARIFIHDACGNRFTALERRARIEVVALAARVKFRSAIRASAFQCNAVWGLGPARGALH